MDGEQTATPRRTSWISDVSNGEVIGFGSWIAGEFGLALTATLVLVHKTVGLPAHAQLTERFLVEWLVTWCGSMTLLAAIGGALVFRRGAPWSVVLTWPWLVGIAIGAAYFFGLSGQMDAGSKLCGSHNGGSCDTGWGMGAVVLSIFGGVLLGGFFVAFASLKRLVLRRRG